MEVKTQNYMTVRTGHINFDFHGIKVIVKMPPCWWHNLGGEDVDAPLYLKVLGGVH